MWPKAKELLTEEGYSVMEAKGGFEMQTDWMMEGAPSSLGTSYARYLVRGIEKGPGQCTVEFLKQNRVESQGAHDTSTGAAAAASARLQLADPRPRAGVEAAPEGGPGDGQGLGDRGRPEGAVARAQSRSGNLHGEPVMGHLHRPLELLARLHEQLRGVGVVPAGQVREDEAPHARLARHPRRLARRGVPRLQRALLLVVAEGGLVDEQVRVLRRPRSARRTAACLRR